MLERLWMKLISGKSKYHIIEVMACPGGCVGGGGQPYHHGDYDIIKANVLKVFIMIDESEKLRKSHENPSIITLYNEFLDKPCSNIAHKYLHTHYFNKSKIYKNEESLTTNE